jgi:hypothetical protein
METSGLLYMHIKPKWSVLNGKNIKQLKYSTIRVC